MDTIDVAIIGGGVVGLAIAAQIARTGRTVFIIEKHAAVGQETSSRNSEVIHAGIYYPARSLKARLCVEGRQLLYALCEKKHIPCKKIGKLIIAQTSSELSRLEELFQHGRDNGVDDVRLLDGNELHVREGHVAGIAALCSPSTGIIDTHRLMSVLLADAHSRDADILYNTEFIKAEKKHHSFCVLCKNICGEETRFETTVLINSAGLEADIVARNCGIDIEKHAYQLHYCKGEYFRVSAPKAQLVNHLIYPMPDAVSLGVHLTPDVAGGLRIGPNAEYIARDRVNYDVSEEKRNDFFSSAHALLPGLTIEDVYPDTSGIRPKLHGPESPVRDFVLVHEEQIGLPGLINCIGIESPGLTASLAIGRYVGDMVEEIL